MLLAQLKTNPLRIKNSIRAVEDWWFDTTRAVHTSGDERRAKASQVVGDVSDSQSYGPVRAANQRSALRDLPMRNHSAYTFIDIGSGKGRVLFLAAELPFRKVLGVEFATHLHEDALANIRQYNHRGQKCFNIESINANAADFEFPNENLVLNLCNPFGPETMARMLAKLHRSIKKAPRHVIVLLLWPELSQMVAEMPGMSVHKQTRRYHIYQTANPNPRPDYGPAQCFVKGVRG